MTDDQMAEVRKYLEALNVRDDAEKVFCSRGIALYQMHIDYIKAVPNPQNERESITIEDTENTTIVLDYIAKKMITSGDESISDMAQSELEKLLEVELIEEE